MKKTSLRPLVLALVALAGLFLFFYRFYRNDMRALENFISGYEAFDRAMSDLEAGATEDGEGRAAVALAELRARSSFRLSSMTKNEREVMAQARETAEFAQKELYRLMECQRAVQALGPEADKLSRETQELSRQRKAAYSRFRALGR